MHAEQWKHENIDPGGGEVLGTKEMRCDDHSDTSRKMQEEKVSLSSLAVSELFSVNG
jgi:hypothetical protein